VGEWQVNVIVENLAYFLSFSKPNLDKSQQAFLPLSFIIQLLENIPVKNGQGQIIRSAKRAGRKRKIVPSI
jgi:hypothetical protein